MANVNLLSCVTVKLPAEVISLLKTWQFVRKCDDE